MFLSCGFLLHVCISFRYYGYRNPHHEVDIRLKCFEERKELFQGKNVLDIGCNIGHITLIVARDFGAKSVVGLDIDRKLVATARKNIRHYVQYADSPPNDEPVGADGGGSGQEGPSDSKFFPISAPIVYGPVDIPGISHGQSPSASQKFPHNVTFVQVILCSAFCNNGFNLTLGYHFKTCAELWPG